ncbi:MAG: hypothetical protein EOP37_26510 [Rubrivivax sp.]|nr:MAG: hypothetical protein EOP37_26510 [Rubrivivax sp.]
MATTRPMTAPATAPTTAPVTALPPATAPTTAPPTAPTPALRTSLVAQPTDRAAQTATSAMDRVREMFMMDLFAAGDSRSRRVDREPSTATDIGRAHRRNSPCCPSIGKPRAVRHPLPARR